MDPYKDGSSPGQNLQPVDNWAALVDKYIQYLLSGKRVPAITVVIAAVWMFVQDNAAGRLSTWRDLLWTTQKCSAFMVIYFVIALARFLGRRRKTHATQTTGENRTE